MTTCKCGNDLDDFLLNAQEKLDWRGTFCPFCGQEWVLDYYCGWDDDGDGPCCYGPEWEMT
jgi:hypothetical protein